ncbi:MAG: AAA family ATPase [Gammaproteobacteria bacterium]
MTEQQQFLLAALREAAFYPHPVGQIELVETHISWIFLTGRYAYKLKKPVDLGFVDFSSLAKRRWFCNEELRLNQRLAPELYLRVVPIGGSAGQPQFDAEPALEYAVQMRQFDQHGLLSRLAQRGELQPAHIDQLADGIADFHQRIAGQPVPADYGEPAQIARWAEQNFSQIAPLLENDRQRAELDQLHAWSRHWQDTLQSCFSARRQQGLVREGHGDLHLGNIVLLDGQVKLFDCLEFNPELRWLDVQNDLVFAVMDLHDRGLTALAYRLLNRYLERSGDYAGLQVHPFYAVYRALVRAKVGLLRLQQDGLSAAEQATIWREFQSYMTLAGRLSSASSPCLYLTHGLSASGKSTVAGQLVEQLGAVRIRADVERKRLHGLEAEAASGANLNDGIYSEDATRRTYQYLTELAETVLQAGFSAVIDATFLRQWQRALFLQLAERLGVPVLILDLQAPLAVLQERLRQREIRGGDPSEATLDVLAAQCQNRDPLSEQERAMAVPVDTSQLDRSTCKLPEHPLLRGGR